MKITKKKEIISEEVQVIPGTYYFENDLIVYKMEIGEPKDGWSEFRQEKVVSFSDKFGISVEQDDLYSEDDIPYYFKQFYLGIQGKKIEKEEFYKEKEDVLKRIL